MTKEEILAMKPGRELNIRVAEDIMEYEFAKDEIFGDMQRDSRSVWMPLQPYSEDPSVAYQVIGKLEDNYSARIEFNYHTENWEAEIKDLESGQSFSMVSALDVAEAICKAALLVILEKEDGFR